jgi:hypothetical protein
VKKGTGEENADSCWVLRGEGQLFSACLWRHGL